MRNKIWLWASLLSISPDPQENCGTLVLFYSCLYMVVNFTIKYLVLLLFPSIWSLESLGLSMMVHRNECVWCQFPHQQRSGPGALLPWRLELSLTWSGAAERRLAVETILIVAPSLGSKKQQSPRWRTKRGLL